VKITRKQEIDVVTNMKRRTMLKGTLTAGVVGIAAGAGLLSPRMVLAAWPKNAFNAEGVDSALNALLGSSSLNASGDIQIKAPPIAENGAVVGVTVSTGMSNVDSITILAEKNNNPLAASFNLASNTQPFVGTRIKLAKTSSVIAVVRSGGKLYSAGKEVKVTIGGCGG
jgi:sulfur-oxidizing protein SoxY